MGEFRLCCKQCNHILVDIVTDNGILERSIASRCVHFPVAPDINVVNNPWLTSCCGFMPKLVADIKLPCPSLACGRYVHLKGRIDNGNMKIQHIVPGVVVYIVLVAAVFVQNVFASAIVSPL